MMIKDMLQTGCLIAGILCLFYFGTIVVYAGLSEWFMCIWAAAGVSFLGLWGLLLYQRTHAGLLLRFMTGGAVMVLLTAFILIILIGSRVVDGMYEEPENGLDYVIVLGARVRGDKPTRALRKRLDRAMEYAKENPDTVFILSGGQGPDEGISEAQCMYVYMKENGMDISRLLMEDRSTTTQENMRFSAEFLDPKNDRIGIVSNNFHIFRALLLARSEGYQNICGIPAHSDAWMQQHYVLREICALLVLKIKGVW